MVRAFSARSYADLTESSRDYQQGSGLTPETVDRINRRVSAHLSNLLATQASTRPMQLHKLSAFRTRWGDFGNDPVEAYFDHASSELLLNPKVFLNAESEETKSGKVLRTVTHEFSHKLDRTAGSGKAAFTGMFEPLHGFLAAYAKKNGTPLFLADTKLAYPLTGYWGMAGNLTENLAMEYVGVLSELYLHDPGAFYGLEEHFAESGYDGPPMREVMSRIWGIKPLKADVKRLTREDLWPVDGRAFGLKKKGGVVAWEAGNSREDPLKYLVK